jgi:AraC family transcriptional regulator
MRNSVFRLLCYTDITLRLEECPLVTLTILQNVLEYIDSNIAESISPESLAARAGYSTWHFCRIFRWGVGYSVMDYVRNRRLAFAAHALQSGRKILDISLEYGFETHSGFSKAFRRYFGCSPETYRVHAAFDKPSPPDLLRNKKYIIGGIVMEPRFVTLPAIKIAGYVLSTTARDGANNNSVPMFWTAYNSDGRCEKLHSEGFVKKHDEYGVCFPKSQESLEFDDIFGAGIDNFIGLEIDDGAEVSEDYRVREIPPATYAVFSTPPCDTMSFVSSIQGVWQYAFNEWFPASGYEYAPGCVDFELYDDRCNAILDKVCDIFIPVVKR